MVTIKDVARVAGVSTATVSRVIHDGGHVGAACKARVKKVIDELGYRPNTNAQALVKRTTYTLGVVTPKLSMSFFGTLASGVEDSAREKGYKLLMSNSLYKTESELDAINSLRNHDCQGIILHSEYSDEETLIKLAKDVPGLVLINRYIPSLANRCVWLDNESGAKKATEYLLAYGHRQFAVVTSIYQNRDPSTRLESVKNTLESYGLTLPKKAVAESTANIDGGELAIKELLAKGVKFTAVVAYNDLMAIGAIHALFDAGLRVPEDVSVIGFDDLPAARSCRPRLTTMHYPIEEMAAYAAKLAISLSDPANSPGSKTHLFIPELVERDSVSQRGGTNK
ncbi:LacI family DNA-binding transcriptional regulator [Alteromonas stellipolaris]|jgi:LacI family transcriptional regulator|uniref:LacI family DNA-binding transcriptional regulator n=1 Tax=Alteromonas stellipolaris TaxID=233316 RepID=UPI0007B4575B|nr:LacI family DNA-binding transcriptional regulator [Alteromonas stellipolaris]ANB21687.1 transcriptional regulator [Alteromonas stellipolaris]MDO6533169.1 LacI family DNA-binding transcriptional regulator [Alteromonas stellipolaris]MDO6624972.1 LacI family DNA-binding transcriptional regulator [Alteromonas stellipolaris]MDP2594504.1 LacI family DNA-binding transcriptional regulator [Alteromonas stellipolaris]